MKSTFLKLVVIALTSISVIACSSNTKQENTTVGVVTGAVAGGLAGSLIGGGTGKVIAVGVGAIAGALIGGEIGSKMDSTDNTKSAQVLDKNTTNHSSHWNNKKTGAHYSMRPTSKVFAAGGYDYCRTYTTRAVIGDNTQQISGTACRMTDGTWKTINNS
jgi:surface antigen